MPILARLNALWQTLLRKDTAEAQLDDEVREFYETQVDRLRTRGVGEQEARRLARLQFGHPEQVKEQVRDARASAWLAALLRDGNYAFRKLRRGPMLAAITIITLGVGLGANATIFSIVSRFVLQRPPVGDPQTLVMLYTTHDGDRCCNHFSWPLFMDLREQAKSFSALAAYYEVLPVSLGSNGEPERVWGQAVTANYFDVTQLSMQAGRGFRRDEENAPLVVLSYGLWRRRFGGDANIAGKVVLLSGRPFTVSGVAPVAFRGLDGILNPQFWVPLGNIDNLQPNTSNHLERDYHWLMVTGRLAPGTSTRDAANELRVIARRLAAAHPESDKGGGFHLEAAGALPPRDKNTIFIFFTALTAVALLVLCIACANVANLSLAQASGRRRETAVRLALGAGRADLFRQIFAETLLLALGGGALGLILSLWATQALGAFHVPVPVPLNLTVSVDWRVQLYVLVLSIATGIVFGLAPAWAAAGPGIGNALKGQDMLARPGRIWSLRNVLVVAQMAMSLVLLCATGLFLRSLQSAAAIDVGFRTRGVLMMSIDPRLHGYDAERANRFMVQVRDRVLALPGVVSAAWTDEVPLAGGHRSDGFVVEGRQNSVKIVDMYMGSPGYFETIGTPLIAGRNFAERDASGPRIAVVSELFAKIFFGNENPLGQRVRDGDRVYEIIGITKNIKSRTLGEDPRPVLYRSLAQDMGADSSFTGYTLMVQFNGDAGALGPQVRREIHTLDPALAIFNAETMEDHLRAALFLPRLAGMLFGVFGFVGLTLAAVGLYGVISYWVSQRTREIGIRLAVGAKTTEVQGLIVRQGMLMTAAAVVPGLVAAWMLAKLFTSFLYGIPPNDATTFFMAPLFLAAVTFCACWLPSQRAARVDPSVTLRHE